jgi:FlaA1/EpsC-like NDP-sugar epimerase
VFNGANGGESTNMGQKLAAAASQVRADIAFATLDIFVVIAAYTLGLAVRMLDPLVSETTDLWSDLVIAMPLIVGIHMLANVVAGAYGHVWEHASTSEAARVVVANAGASAVLVFANLLVRAFDPEFLLIPWSVFVVGGLVSLFAMGMVRFRSRLFSLHRLSGNKRVLVIGTGWEAVAFARQAPQLEGERRVIGFLADEPSQANGPRRLAGREILGCLDDVASVVEDNDVAEIVVAGGDADQMKRVVDLCLDVDVRLRMLPAARDVLRDGVSAVDVRDIHVEDLLARKPVETELEAVRDLLEGKVVLVTGAGGSIGSEIVRQALQFGPARVFALDRDETLLHDAQIRWPTEPEVVLADVRDPDRILRVFERVRPDVVFHAAALKHVPVLENHPEEAVLTNIVGTRNVIEAGSRNGMQRFVLISTDKAVQPTSVMGATKRAAELMTQLGAARGDGCVYSAVRFGNVLGSRGSVIPTFVEQIKSGGPVTVTDPEMTRYFMTVDEAVQLVLQASALASGTEVFLLDMGEPIRIETLARRLIRLAGLSPGKDVEIRFTGRRPGEKLSEILALDPLVRTLHEKIYEVQLSSPQGHMLMDVVEEMENLALAGDGDRLVELLRELTDEAPQLGDEERVVVIDDEPVAALLWN